MPLTLDPLRWTVHKIAVVGPGIVGMPMAAMLAHARIRERSSEPALVVVVQRNSPTSGWKVDAINQGRSPIGGVEPDLDRIVKESVEAGLLAAAHDYAALSDADLILISVQTDKKGNEPDYGPLFEALTGIATALKKKPAANIPIIVFESTLAPSSMATVIRDHLASHGLIEGRDILLGNSPNRVMPGRLVERVADSDKIIAGLHPETPGLIRRIYSRIVTRGRLHATNSMTAEVVKTLENAYRDVRIAYATEVVRYCDARDLDFYALRDQVNARARQTDEASSDGQAVPTGGLLVPMLGVGGHCLPKDGILLWWRALEAGEDTSSSLILEARKINDESPAATLALAERAFGSLRDRRVALLGAAYRGNSEDTRNSPTLYFARLLRERGISFTIHDPYVYPEDQNLRRFELGDHFTRELPIALEGAEVVALCTPHRVYADEWEAIRRQGRKLAAAFDACHLLPDSTGFDGLKHAGIGRGRQKPSSALIDAVFAGFQAVEIGVANEVQALVQFLNSRYADTEFNRVRFEEVQRIAGTCPTGCAIANPAGVPSVPVVDGFESRLVALAGRDPVAIG
ncbi:MAG TPA: nucleotide sugar dehydrogenase [Gemmatimonadales bacterium]|nr:nucleotide sugar dehydrogenase [Gemmatimonadales bacterium]